MLCLSPSKYQLWVVIILTGVTLRSDATLFKKIHRLPWQEAKLNECFNALEETLLAAYRSEMWALKMLDASSKFSVGYSMGNAALLGEKEECLQVTHPALKFIGKYCRLNMNFTIVIPIIERQLLDKGQVLDSELSIGEVAICIPSTCSGTHLSDAINNLGDDDFSVTDAIHLKVQNEQSCFTRETKRTYQLLDYAFLFILCSIAVLTFLSSIYDYYCRRYLQCDAAPVSIAFSVYSNGKKLVVSSDAHQFGCLHGLKALSMFGIIYGHAAMMVIIGPFTANRIDMMTNIVAQKYVTHNNAHNITDTFFVMGAMLLVVGFFKDVRTKGGYDYPAAFIKRYLRLTPTYAFILMFILTLRQDVGNGDPSMTYTEYRTCYANWHNILMYIQNYRNVGNTCLKHGWYMEAEMHLFLVAPFLLFSALKWPKSVAVVSVLLSFAAASYEFYLGLKYDMGPVVTYARSIDHVKYDHFLTHARCSPWFFGIFIGFIFLKLLAKGDKFKLSTKTNLVLWIVIGSAFMLSQNALYFFDFDYTQPASAINLSYRRLVWSSGVAWIIIACVTGHGGLMNSFLCWKPFEFFSKISYSVYVVHIIVLEIIVWNSPDKQFGSFTNVFSMFLFYTIWSCIAGTALTIFIEFPCANLSAIIFQRITIFRYPKKKNKPVTAPK